MERVASSARAAPASASTPTTAAPKIVRLRFAIVVRASSTVITRRMRTILTLSLPLSSVLATIEPVFRALLLRRLHAEGPETPRNVQ